MKIKIIITAWFRLLLGWGLFKSSTNLLLAGRQAQCKSNTCGSYAAGVCLECGCVTKAKSLIFTENCPLNMWAPEHQTYQGQTYVDLEEVPDGLKVLFIQKSGAFAWHPDLPCGFIELKEWESFMQWCDDNYASLASS